MPGTLAACDDLLVRPTVVIVDDDSGFRSLARALLEAEGFDVVGEADDGASALAAVDLLHPWVVLLDIQLPGIDGFEVAEQLAGAGDPPVVVLVSARGVSSYRRRLARQPARGVFSKRELSGEALAALGSWRRDCPWAAAPGGPAAGPGGARAPGGMAWPLFP